MTVKAYIRMALYETENKIRVFHEKERVNRETRAMENIKETLKPSTRSQTHLLQCDTG